MALSYHIFIIRVNSQTDCIPRLTLVAGGQIFNCVLFCHVLAHFVFVLQVSVKNIPKHNTHVPLGQLKDLTAH